jgi:vacuolar protein sorting-associated protein 18
MQLLDSTPVLKIEDILPFFPDFVVIDDFKDEICAALEGHSAHMEALKAEMEEATRTAESIKSDIKNLQSRSITLEATEKCAICEYTLLIRQFYVFPCQHCFHADRLIGQACDHDCDR